jgi:lipoprotein signal peptidase
MIVLGVLATVVFLDQATKWWGWRHAPHVRINRGGSPFIPSAVDGWYAGPATGALLDLLDVGLLGFAVSLLVLRRRSAVILVPGALMLAGWASNLLDRLGLHYWTAPGSIRGAVDFIPVGRIRFNVADGFIVVGTVLFVLAVSARYLATLAPNGSATARANARSTNRRRARTWPRTLVMAGAVGLVAVVGVGATNYDGVTVPSRSDHAPAPPMGAGWSRLFERESAHSSSSDWMPPFAPGLAGTSITWPEVAQDLQSAGVGNAGFPGARSAAGRNDDAGHGRDRGDVSNNQRSTKPSRSRG